jgi:hypothetical protein
MGSWGEQWDRVQLGLARIQDVYRGRAEPEGTKGAYYDVFTFFVHCHHLADWIEQDPRVRRSVQRKARAFLNKSSELRICSDLANRSKHSALNWSRTRDPATGPSGNDATVMIGRGASHAFRVSSGGAEVDALVLAEKCVAIWAAFIASNRP